MESLPQFGLLTSPDINQKKNILYVYINKHIPIISKWIQHFHQMHKVNGVLITILNNWANGFQFRFMWHLEMLVFKINFFGEEYSPNIYNSFVRSIVCSCIWLFVYSAVINFLYVMCSLYFFSVDKLAFDSREWKNKGISVQSFRFSWWYCTNSIRSMAWR